MIFLASLSTLVMINLLCGCLALCIGFVAGAWFLSAGKQSRQAPQEPNAKQNEAIRAAEQALMASGRLKDLAKSMASDVGAHASQVNAINTGLKAYEAKHHGSVDHDVMSAVEMLVKANTRLEKQLAVAEQQIETQAAAIRSQESEARTDSLTGLANRRAFDIELERRAAEWRRKGTAFSLLILDIDHFKDVNDRYGHQAGDEVLRRIGATLAATIRDMDVCCRYGGEEFAVIMPSTDLEQACQAAERVRSAIESTESQFDGNLLKVTASIGVTKVLEQERESQVIRRADQALYESKNAGRNCTHFHDGRACRRVGTDMAPPAAASAGIEARPMAPSGPALLDRLPDGHIFSDELQRRIAESHRFGAPLSIVHLAVEDFDSLECYHGGDVVLAALESLAHDISRTIREIDLLAYRGDGEFAVMLPGSTLADARQRVEGMRTVLRDYAASAGDISIELSLCYGVVQSKPGDSAEGLIKRSQAETEAFCPPAAAAF